MSDISFAVTGRDRVLITNIVRRAIAAAKSGGWNYDKMDATMDITACHANGNPLDLKMLLKADDFTFAHDVFGIRKHLNRETGALDGFFVPRCHKREG